MSTDKILGRASLGIFLLRYGNQFPYTSLLIQSLKASHYVALERNIDDLKAFVAEVRQALSSYVGEELTITNIRVLFQPENRRETSRILLESINLDRLERVCSSIYVTAATCIATGLSSHAAKFGLGLNVSSAISHALFRIIRPMIPDSQPLLRFFSRAACASVGILAAFRLEKSLLVWANCILGADLLVSAAGMLLNTRRPLPIEEADLSTSDPVGYPQTSPLVANIRTVFVWTLAGTSLVYQNMPGRDMPVWLKGVLIGPRMLEYGLQALSLSIKGNENKTFFI